MNLRGLLDQAITVEFHHGDPQMFNVASGDKSDAEVVDGIYSLVAGAGVAVPSEILAALYQDDDAHDTCSLTACLNPLHPGPCKGWKGTLHSVSPGAWHSLEAARVEKANANRVKKIAALKAQGKPIPHKLLTPIVAKTHPDAGKTANKASGEAHAAGKAVSDAAGVHPSAPGKVTLGQAVKKAAPVELGPKGKKPTVASKGIAHVIAQEKVTPQYKLDKAAAITPEQWAGLSAEDKATVRSELAKIQKDGFGPQQKKATDLLAKLPEKTEEPKPETVTTPSGKVYQKVTLKDSGSPPVVKEKKQVSLNDQNGILVKPSGFGPSTTTSAGLPNGYKITKDNAGYSLKHNGKLIRTSATKEALTDYAHKHDEKLKGVVAKATPPVVKEMNEGKPGLASDEAVNKLSDALKKPKPLPKHVQEATDMANGHAPGASWSKNHLAAYQKLSPEEFHGLPPETQGKIVAELKKGETKFLDPKKVQATKDLLAAFGKGPSTANVDKTPKPVASEKPISFLSNLHDHNVTQAQAKDVAAGMPPSAHFLAAKQSAGLTFKDNPYSNHPSVVAEDFASGLTEAKIGHLDPAITKTPAVKDAIGAYDSATIQLAKAQEIKKAKTSALNKISQALAADDGKLAPIQKASLEQFQKQINDHPVKTDTEHLGQLTAEQKDAEHALDAAIAAAKKKASAPAVADMTDAQLNDRVKDLLGPDAVKSKFAPDYVGVNDAMAGGKKLAADVAKTYPQNVLDDPAVMAKQDALAAAQAKLLLAQKTNDNFNAHITAHHLAALTSGKTPAGEKLTPEDHKAIVKHAAKLGVASGAGSGDAQKQQKEDVLTALDDFKAAADKAQEHAKPAEPVKLSDFDQKAISDSYQKAWATHANKAATYGLKTYDQQHMMKAHPEYPLLGQNLADLKVLAGKVALAHAAENTAHLNVPTDSDTGALEHGPEHDAWLAAVAQREELTSQFNQLHKQAQARLDTIRTSVGLKKRALPKVDSPAVKVDAAESGYVKSGAFNGPNAHKQTAAKHYMMAKVGPKLGVVHQTASDKAAAKSGTKLGGTAAPATSTPKIKNAAASPTVKLTSEEADDDVIAHIPEGMKAKITSDFKSFPSGKYLADPPEDIFNNLVSLAAAHGPAIPYGLSVGQVMNTIDETHSKNLGVANSGMLAKKIGAWLGTADGKAYAESHTKADPKIIKQLSGELDLPNGVKLEPGAKVQAVAGPGPYDEYVGPPAFKKITAKAMRELQAEQMKAEGIKWSPAQKKALNNYSGSQYPYNTYLRDQGGATAAIKQQVIDIQSTMMPAPANILLKRGTGYINLPDGFQSAAEAKKLVGKTFQDKGFVSSTVAGESGHFSSHPLQLTIEAPKGTAGVWMNDVSDFKDKENEYLLAAGTKFHVISVEQRGGFTHMRVRVVSD